MSLPISLLAQVHVDLEQLLSKVLTPSKLHKLLQFSSVALCIASADEVPSSPTNDIDDVLSPSPSTASPLLLDPALCVEADLNGALMRVLAFIGAHIHRYDLRVEEEY